MPEQLFPVFFKEFCKLVKNKIVLECVTVSERKKIFKFKAALSIFWPLGGSINKL